MALDWLELGDELFLTRKEFFALLGALSCVGGWRPSQGGGEQGVSLALEELKAAEKLAGLEFTDEQRQQILSAVQKNVQEIQRLHSLSFDYTLEPPLIFRPGLVPKDGFWCGVFSLELRDVSRPSSSNDLAFLSVHELSILIRTRQVSPVELTKIYLDRLTRYGEKLLCLVTLTEGLALEQARRAEQEIMRGDYRSVVHGIPYGIKDLFAVRGYPTTWGSEPHKEQVFDYDASVVEKLTEAGAVLVAKLSLGALAQGDVWFKGRTRNPWNIEQGSSGSSAGSATATAAGLVGFSIGTETLGSIMSPCHRCRVSGLRPTYGRVSRFGAMAVSWTMDKIGPIARSVEDCAYIFGVIQGADVRDPSSVSAGYMWPPSLSLSSLRVGYLVEPGVDLREGVSNAEREEYYQVLKNMGVSLRPVQFEQMYPGVNLILGVEASAAFDEFTRSDRIHELRNSAWPRTYRTHRYIPAVEYLQAQRARALM
ncbi:MAG: amidase, partial [Candidatus Caldarchaeum sp.]